MVYYTASSHGKGERNANQGMKGSQEMSKTNLKPCPKCGGNATVIWEEGENYRVECVDCPRHGGLYRTEEEAVAAWNRLPRGGNGTEDAE